MRKNHLIGITFTVACIIILASFTNVIGVQTVKPSDKKIVIDNSDQKELLFQIIIDIANNKEIRNTLQKSDIRNKIHRLFNPNIKISLFARPIITKKFLHNTYNIGFVLSRVLSKSKMQSIFERYQLSNVEMNNKLAFVIERNDELSNKIKQLSALNCDCKNDDPISWNFPVICALLVPFVILVFISAACRFTEPLYILGYILAFIDSKLNCPW